jgi:hypothetical protein
MDAMAWAPQPEWSILILTMSSRQDKFLFLLSKLLPQCAGHRVEVVALYSRPGGRVPQLRQEMLNDARGRFVSFVDDDDLVAPNFVSAIMAAIQDPEVDSVGFQVAIWDSGVRLAPCYNTRQFGLGWWNEPSRLIRDWSMLNPVRKDIADRCTYLLSQGVGEDYEFGRQLVPLLGKEAYIDEELYYYIWDRQDSVQIRLKPHPPGCVRRPRVEHPHFRWHFRSEP